MESDDELARTATAEAGASDASPGAKAVTLDQPGGTIGRYRLERRLGVGGMGVVHVAFDPNLERRIALKVLRAGGGEAARRLQNEARAMARLTHPNVVTVHEVDTAGGRDYVAMELIEGTNLAEWLRAEPRDATQILDAFLAAGRGLAAAHDAGIVHRDFKPHNVLRSRGGRIAVTDFGLAREAVTSSDPLAETQELTGASATTSVTPSSLAGLTVTGAVLGTPAYMAPEQWAGKAVTPATDQFAFCVALWEALAGERPYRGPSIEELRAQVTAGPDRLDASRLPRRLRDVLRRGLAPDPKDRWPSMHELLETLARATRRRGLVLGAAGAGLAATGVLVFAIAGRGPDAPACAAPRLDPSAVWSPAAREALMRAGQAEAVRALDADLATWRQERAAACAAPPVERSARLTCLDGVLARFEGVTRALEGAGHRDPANASSHLIDPVGRAEAATRTSDPVGAGEHVDVGSRLIDPVVCRATPTPRIVAATTPPMREAMVEVFRAEASPVPVDNDTIAALRTRFAADPCALAAAYPLIATAQVAMPERERAFSEAERAAEQCGDDRLRAEVMLAAAARAIESSFLGETAIDRVRRAEVAVQRVAQADLRAVVERLRSSVAVRADELEEAITRARAAADGFASRRRIAEQVRVELELIALRQRRGRSDDIAAIADELGRLRKLAGARLGPDARLVRRIDIALAQHALAHGRVAEAHAELARLRRPQPQDRARGVRGVVLDGDGKPLAGAKVYASKSLTGTTVSVATTGHDPSWREAVTDADGRFAISDAPDVGVVVAEHGAQRTRPVALADRVELRVVPTSRVEGRVDLAGTPAPSVGVLIAAADAPPELSYLMMAPVAADGSFAIEGVWRGQVRVFAAASSRTGAVESATLDVREPIVRGVALQIASMGRQIHVIVRSTVGLPVPNAQVLTMPGRFAVINARALERDAPSFRTRMARPLEGERAPPAVLAVSRPGDLVATLGAPEGEGSACSLGLPADLGEPGLQQKINSNLEKLELRCVPIPIAAEAVVVEVPPWPRLDP